ncbi:MAG: endonuclease Q family protein [Deltaproteobacteria bacterium]
MQLKDYFVDLHVHIGRTSAGKQVKYASAGNLTFENIAHECVVRKGIDVVGIVDCASPGVIYDIRQLIEKGEAREIPDGGILYREKLCIILGSEIETSEFTEEGSCAGHCINFFPTIDSITQFSDIMKRYIKNINLSSQKARLPAKELQKIVESLGGIHIPAHAFTPHKSYYGNCIDRLAKLYGEEGFKRIIAIELGLSADTYLADKISELKDKTFLSNSDAHSLPKIAREYNLIEMENGSFKEIVLALKKEGGRRIRANYGLNPKLGKYHRTYCESCDEKIQGELPVKACGKCDSKNVVMGVLDRIETIKDNPDGSPEDRPPYINQIPLEYIPKLGEKTINRLLEKFGTEMNILHYAEKLQLQEIVSTDIAENILKAREGNLEIVEGGGGLYGSIKI